MPEPSLSYVGYARSSKSTVLGALIDRPPLESPVIANKKRDALQITTRL